MNQADLIILEKARVFWKQVSILQGFPCGLAGKESSCIAEDLVSIPGLGRSPGEAEGYSLQYSGLENSMDCIIHGVEKSQTQLSDFHFFRLSLFWQYLISAEIAKSS